MNKEESLTNLQQRIENGLELHQKDRPTFIKWVDEFVIVVKEYFRIQKDGDNLAEEWMKITADEKPSEEFKPLPQDAGKVEQRCSRCGAVLTEKTNGTYKWGKLKPVAVCASCLKKLQGNKMFQ